MILTVFFFFNFLSTLNKEIILIMSHLTNVYNVYNAELKFELMLKRPVSKISLNELGPPIREG